MELSKQHIDGINVALNEATWLGFEVVEENRIAVATFGVFSLDEQGKVPKDNRVQFIFTGLKRIACSFRDGTWGDEKNEAIPLDVSNITQIVEQIKSSIYGWEFIDSSASDFSNWKNRLSLDYTLEEKEEAKHTIDLFQETPIQVFDFKMWFDNLKLFVPHPEYHEHDLETFISNGTRAWDELQKGNEELQEVFGISRYEDFNFEDIEKKK